MYKVFINNTPVFFTERAEDFEKFGGEKLKFSKKKKLKQWVENYTGGSFSKGMVYHYDLDELWYFFRRVHVFVKAAGGLVENERGELLFIFRKGKWDLPKGKMEKREMPDYTAVREVEEECGVSELTIHTRLVDTYHTYHDYGEPALKKTYWYKMRTSFDKVLVPQIEEDIEKVEWVKKSDLRKVTENTYEAIIDVLRADGIEV